jgi:hypothetical protein
MTSPPRPKPSTSTEGRVFNKTHNVAGNMDRVSQAKKTWLSLRVPHISLLLTYVPYLVTAVSRTRHHHC